MPPVPRSSLDPARRLSGWLDRRVRDLPPGRRLRQLLALELVERHAAGRDGALTVLDAGCEEGLLCLELARRHPGWRLVAADLAAPALRRGRTWALEEGLAVSFVQLDVTRSLGTAAYDVVLSLECLEEVPDDQAALRAMATALRPGGLFVGHVPTADWSPVLKGAARTWRREVRHGYDPGELRSRLEALGLGVLEVSPTFRRTTALAQDLRDACKTTPPPLAAAAAAHGGRRPPGAGRPDVGPRPGAAGRGRQAGGRLDLRGPRSGRSGCRGAGRPAIRGSASTGRSCACSAVTRRP